MNRLHLIALVLLVALSVTLVSLFFGHPLNIQLLSKFSLIISMVAAAIWLFDRYLWRLPWLFDHFVASPNMDGTWHAEAYIRFPSQTDSQNHRGQVQIRQRFFSIFIHINWDDGSYMSFHRPVPIAAETGHCSFSATYDWTSPNTQASFSQTRSAGFFCYANEPKPSLLVIYYSTSDGQQGQIKLQRPI